MEKMGAVITIAIIVTPKVKLFGKKSRKCSRHANIGLEDRENI